VGLCPFHSEKTPSFTVSPEKEMFYCFGCGIGGNVFTFLMKIENLTFEEAVRSLAARFGVAIAERPISPNEKKRRDSKEKVGEAVEAAARFYNDILLRSPEGEEGREYLKSRNYDIGISREFRLGWAPREWDSVINHLKARGFSEHEAEAAGLAVERDRGGFYDRFRGRIVFPILSVQNRVLGFGGRLVKDEDGPKYLNSPETALYKKSEALYGIHAAKSAMRERDAAIIVEGYFDCLALHKNGFTNAIATCGTALTVQHVRIISRYTKNIYPLFDADEAGRKAERRALEVILAASANAYHVALPSGDPDSFLEENGTEEMADLLKNAEPLLDATIDSTIKANSNGVAGRQKALKEIAAMLAGMADTQAMELYIRESASKILPGAGADSEQLLRDEIKKIKRIGGRRGKPAREEHVEEKRKAPAHEIYMLALCINNREILEMLRSNPDLVEDLENEEIKSTAETLIQNDEPVALNSLPPAIADMIAGHLMEFEDDKNGDAEKEIEKNFIELARRIRTRMISRMKKEIDEKFQGADENEQIKLLKEKTRLLKKEAALAKDETIF